MFGASKSGQSIGKPDPQFNYVTALLHGDGTNGAQNNTFLDSSSNAFTVTRGGTPTQGSWSAYGSLWSNYFGGSGNYLSVSDATPLNLSGGSYTLEFWIYPSGNYTDYNTVISKRIGGSSAWEVFLSQTTGYLAFFNGTIYSSSVTPSTNTWNHVAAVYDGTNINLYLNGTRVLQSAITNTDYSASIYVGSFPTYNEQFIGYVSNVRVTKGGALYTTTFTPPTSPLTTTVSSGTVSLLTCQSNRFIDNSTNNFAITIVGTPSVQRFNPFLPTYSQAYSTSVYGGSAYFNGSTDYLTLASNTAFNIFGGNMTVECWFNANILSGSGHLFAFVETSTSRESIYFNSSQLTFYSVNALGGANNIATSALSPNTWYHMALVKNGATFTLYLNGVSVGTSTTLYYSIANQSLQIGTYNNASYGPDCFNGYICDVRVVKGTAVYTSNFTPPTAPLTAISGTSYLGSMTNGAIYDNAMMNDLVTVGSAQISTSVKKYGTGSLSFNGSTDYLYQQSSQNTNFGTGDFTMEGWFYQTGLATNYPGIISNPAPFSGAGAWAVLSSHISSGVRKLQVYFYDYSVGSPLLLGTTTLSDNTWYYFAFTRSGTTFRLFLNGTIEATVTYSGNFVSTSAMVVGCNQTNYFFQGYIDDIRITKGYARYTSNFTPPTAALPNYGSST
jgi:hypothetical protein